MSILLILVFSMGMILLLSVVSFLLSFWMGQRLEKSTPFECGFDSLVLAHSPFSTRFFLLCVLFLIFDIELTLLIPLSISLAGTKLAVVLALFFLILLTMGTLFEFNSGVISWMA